jgi:hypothetical protein
MAAASLGSNDPGAAGTTYDCAQLPDGRDLRRAVQQAYQRYGCLMF